MIYKFLNRNLFININQLTNSRDGNPRFKVTAYNAPIDNNGDTFFLLADHKKLCNIFDQVFKTKLCGDGFIFISNSYSLVPVMITIEDVLVKMANVTITF